MPFFWTNSRLLQRSTLRIAYLVAFVVCFITTEIGRKVYRPYIYSHHIDDWGIADSIGNSLGTLTQIFLYLGVVNATKIESYRIIGFVTLGYIAYEVLQPILPRGTFDLKDVYATLCAGVLSVILVTLIHYFNPDHSPGPKSV
jgi:hypothetical protein